MIHIKMFASTTNIWSLFLKPTRYSQNLLKNAEEGINLLEFQYASFLKTAFYNSVCFISVVFYWKD